ncbi:host specificity protein J, partial [Tatumella terrea]
MKSTHNITIQGKKGGSRSSSYTPVEQSDDLLSDAKLKMLVAVCEGETEGAVTAQQIYLNDTVLANEDGTYNFTGVNWEFRNGTQDQEYIQGMPEIDNELSVGVAVTTSSPWTHQFTDTSLDAIRIKLSLPAQYQYKDNGDMVGTVTEYAIDLSTDGGSYETVVSDKFDGKTTSEYQRDHRINLTRGGTTWAIRVRRITADSTSTKLVNAFRVYSCAEVVDSKLRYPNTALLYVEVDAGQFTSGAPKVTVKMKGKLIRVPDNYDPDTREYTGTWDGSFKMAYSNNPAWVFYDIILDKISGMGNRIDASMIDKWELYQIAEYCDEMVSDGAGGKEPRFTCNAYIQSQEDAFTVLQDFAAIFRGITFWGNSQIIVSADAPVDGPEWTYTAANVVDGLFSYAGGSYKNRYTSCLVSYSDPQNHYSDTTEAVYDADLLSRYGVQQMSLTAIGCTSQSEAHRRGRWALLSNAKDGTVSFSVGLDGHIPLPASVIGIADPYRAGKTNGGRISSVSGLNLTLDRAITFGAGDRLIVNLPDGTAQTRTIAGVSDDKKTVTVSTAFKTTPVAGAVWIIDSDNLAIQQFRVTSVTDNDDGTFTVAAVQYDPEKYSYIDDGVMVGSAPVTVTPATVMSAPGNITVNEVSHTSQGISLSSLQVAWDAVKGAVKYSAQWRRDSGEWINAGSVSSQGFTVNNIYAGIYEVRVRSVNSSGVSSPWGASDAVTLTGKQGKPPVPLSLTASDNTVFGIDLSWAFGDGSDDGLKTTLMVSTLSDHSDETLLADIPYPQSTYSLTGLASGVARYFRAAFTDKSGNQSDRTDYVTGRSSSNASDVLSYISGEISKTDLGKDLTTEIDAKADQSTVQQQISDASQQAQAAIDKATESSNSAISDANKAIEQANNAISTEIGDRIAAVQSEASARADALLNEENARKADINTVQTLIRNDSESLAQQIAQVAAGTGEQFDPYKIWYFDDKSVDGWSGNGDPTVTDDGWLKPADSDSEFATSPSGLGINGMAYQFIKARLKKVGSPEWVGEILWKNQSGDFSDQQSMVVTEPEYDENNIATLTVHDIPWQSMTVDQFRLNLTSSQSDDNYIIFDWISVGRPTPGAGMAALQQEQTARVEADAAEATSRNTLAAQLRGPYTGTDASQVTSGLIYSEQQLRISGDKAEATARQALSTKIDDSVSSINQSLDTLNTQSEANTSDITSLKSSLNDKADASALSALQATVTQQGDKLTSQGNSITSLQNSLSGKADSSALSSLSNTVTQQGDKLNSQSDSITAIRSGLTVGDNMIPNPYFDD